MPKRPPADSMMRTKKFEEPPRPHNSQSLERTVKFENGPEPENPGAPKLRHASDAYYEAIKRAAYAADTSRGKVLAHKLMRNLDDERKVLSKMRGEGTSDDDMDAYVLSSPKLIEVRALYLELGIARMITLGDWSVNREDEIPRSMGVATFAEIETMMLHFHKKHGFLNEHEADQEAQEKLVHLDLGCGNGVVGEKLRRDTATHPLGEEDRLKHHWTEIGYADRIYFTLNDLLYKFLKAEHTNNPALIEFIDLISTLLTRRIYYSREHEQNPSDQIEILLQLPSNPNLIRKVLESLGSYIPNLTGIAERGSYKVDNEYLEDSEPKEISADCIALIKEYFGVDATDAFMDRSYKWGSTAFLDKHFDSKLWKRDGDLERKIENLDQDISDISLRITELEKGLRIIGRRKESPRTNDAVLKNTLVAERLELSSDRKRFSDEIKDKKAKIHNLAEDITIYPHNVVIDEFENFGDIFPEEPTFDFVTSFRATSHLEDWEYGALMLKVAKRLKPGGIMIEDGVRESYTRYERVQELIALQQQLGNDYRIRVIVDSKGVKSVLMERTMFEACGGGRVFFAGDKECSDKLLAKGCSYVPIEDFANDKPEVIFRNEIIKKLKELLIDTAIDVASDKDERLGAIFRGRMAFRGIHRGEKEKQLDEILRRKLSECADLWADLKSRPTNDAEYQSLLNEAYKVVKAEIDKVRQRVAVVEAGAMPLGGYDRQVKTFPCKLVTDNSRGINKPRGFPIGALPRGTDIPDLTNPELEAERVALINSLKQLKELIGKPPIQLIEFDNCFTNPMMIEMLQILLGYDFGELVQINNVKLRSGKYPQIQDNDKGIYILGGSTDDIYDEDGQAFTSQYSLKLLKNIASGGLARAIAICFGSQSMLEAFGIHKGCNFTTELGALQFGAFPVEFTTDPSHPSLSHLGGRQCSTAFTRSGYSITERYEGIDDIDPLAFECSMGEDGLIVDKNRYPVAFSLFGGKIITTQLHPEIKLTDQSDLHRLRQFSQRSHDSINYAFGARARYKRVINKKVLDLAGCCEVLLSNKWTIAREKTELSSPNRLHHNFSLPAIDTTGRRTQWVAKDIGPAFFIPTLQDQTNSLLGQLQ